MLSLKSDCKCFLLQESQSEVSQDKRSDLILGDGPGECGDCPPSVTSTTARKRKEKEVKQATIRQHYYPEGGWGYVVLFCASLVNILAHGLQMSFSVILVAILARWRSQNIIGASKFTYLIHFAQFTYSDHDGVGT